jgi:hypothetical protein
MFDLERAAKPIMSVLVGRTYSVSAYLVFDERRVIWRTQDRVIRRYSGRFSIRHVAPDEIVAEEVTPAKLWIGDSRLGVVTVLIRHVRYRFEVRKRIPHLAATRRR